VNGRYREKQTFRLCSRLACPGDGRQPSDTGDLLIEAAPPDEELVDLIEEAFLEGQIDGGRADLAYLWLMQHGTGLR